MSDSPKLDQQPREIQPDIPVNHELRNWRGVYLHRTKADRAIPVLFRGLWSVGFSHLSNVNKPMKPSGFSPVQEEEGWEWISVYDSDDKNIPWRDVNSSWGENVTFVVKKLPYKTKESTAERKMIAEKLIKWRVAPRDLVALWVSDTMLDQSVGNFVETDIGVEGMERIYRQFLQLSRLDKDWNEKMIKASNEASKKANEKYRGASYQIIGEIVKTETTKLLIIEWLNSRYQITRDSKMTDLLKRLEEDSGVKIYMVMGDGDTKKTMPIHDIT